MATDLKDKHIADLHALAAEAGVEGYRKLSREELVRAISESGVEPAPAEPAGVEPDADEVVVEATVVAAGADEAVEVDAAGAREPDGPEPDTEEVSGILEILPQRYGFLRMHGLEADPGDVYISASQVRRCELRTGDEVAGPAREPRRGERHRALVHVDQVNGEEPLAAERPEFGDLAPVPAERRVAPGDEVLARAIDLLAPLALGQRVLVRAAPRAGRTTLLRGIARGLQQTEGVELIVLLIDERPEEATAWREAVPDAQFAIATADMAPADQVRVAELALERGRRRAETGGDAVLLVDSLSRLAYADGGPDAVKHLFGSGRNLNGAGSLTVVATTLAGADDEGEAERAVATTENALVTLDPELAAAGVHPAIVPGECRISNEEMLRDPQELDAARKLRSLLADLDPPEAAALLRERIEGSASNAELLAGMA